ncbi:hypothetical protein SAMN05660209_04230 [Geodermatophilus africanus]|uniref:Glycoprotein n=1 Tax=Geodermatophilus africanus TaxID=1137993 RepID=A0A1H3L3P6_9ACTN|nr:DUF6049 family protein [Geodermatophilus africanus]SDY59043.1 hypothetical protein SAMN05660209_03259 [Geodermatophilus africanus]SDY97470.1 hypothetical protein SAMN05660209_04230 [Geodermatophilus africanus]
MSRPAAGRTGGRSAARGPGRTARGTTVAAALAGVLTAPLVTLAPAAAAAPREPATTEATSDERPVGVRLTRLDPRTLVPGATVTIEGELTNTGTETLTDLDVRLQRGEPLDTRGELQAVDGDPDPVAVATTPFQDVTAELPPGGAVPFSLTTTSDALAIDRDGVHPVLLNLNGIGADGERRRVGELTTYLVQPPAVPATPTGVAWLWPLVERTHRDASGTFVDDRLTDEVAAGGRLDRALATVERLPETAPPEGGEPAPVVPVTLAVDPALVEELQVMADGPYPVGGEEDAGSGSDEAAAWLTRLRAVAADHPVVALPYGDVDADSLTGAGLSAVVSRSLPGSAEGTAQDDPDAPAAPPTGAPAETEADGTAGADILREVLGVEARTDLAWAVGGALRPETLDVLRDGGVEEVVLAPGGLIDGAAALGLEGPAVARTTVPAGDGAVDALVADPALSGLAGGAPVAGGPRAAEQRSVAELVLQTLQPGDAATGQTLLVAPPREVDPDPATVSAVMAAAATLPGLRPLSVAQLGDGPVADTGELAAPEDPGGLEAAGLADVAEAVRVRDQLAGAVVGNADAVLAPWDAAVARTTSAAWRDDPAAFLSAAADLRTTVRRLLERVTLLAPAAGIYSLASSDSPLVLTVSNELPFALRVQLRVQSRGNALSVGDLGDQVLGPEQRTTLQVPAQVRQSGRFGVAATLVTPDGAPLGDPVQLQVQSTAYGTISVVITIGAAALLGLLFLRRLVRFVLRRRRGVPGDEDGDLPGPAPEGAAVPLPPTRSPV